jgi:hypothetical protein
MRELQRELVVAGRNGRMRREDAERPHGIDVLLRDKLLAAVADQLGEQRQHQQARVALVHVVALQPPVAERAQHLHAADPEDGLLAQPVAQVAAIEEVREGAVGLGSLWKVGVEQQHGD